MMNIAVETDKRINVYRIWEGKQLILCKQRRKKTRFNDKDWVIMWPRTQPDEFCSGYTREKDEG